MKPETQKEYIDIAVNEWMRYAEMFPTSKLSITYLRTKGFSWEDIAQMYIDAIETNQEIDLVKRR